MPMSLVADPRGDVGAAVDALPEEEFIVYGPSDAKHTVTVFTDVNCPYCRQMHNEIEDYHLFDIRIRYAAFPSVHPDSLPQMEAVWCSEDPHRALDEAKAGRPVAAEPCDNPVADHLVLAQEMGFFGTPAIVTPKGEVRFGYVSAPDLADLLEQEAGSN
ncbi:DsbC family protein [Ectothiorhodospiraceae bacterium 2226]|nr:DsbC family protein [Ectothiorhodospiraceae bacterium 2226]